MHGKERVIAPLLQASLGLNVATATGLNTDQFGTFSREIERKGCPLDAARAKIAAAFECAPGVRVGLASEGSFGPHPLTPFAPLGRELVLLIDRDTGLELSGHDGCHETNFAHRVVVCPEDAIAFADDVGFPRHGLVVIGCVDGKPSTDVALLKDVHGAKELWSAVETVINNCGAAFLETDMRAHRNPMRMRAIERATLDLVRRFQSRCQACAWPGYDVSTRIPGLPCDWCGAPTSLPKAEVWTCLRCPHREERPAVGGFTADAAHCEACNP